MKEIQIKNVFLWSILIMGAAFLRWKLNFDWDQVLVEGIFNGLFFSALFTFAFLLIFKLKTLLTFKNSKILSLIIISSGGWLFYDYASFWLGGL